MKKLALLLTLALCACSAEPALEPLAVNDSASSLYLRVDGGNDTLIRYVDFSLDGGTPTREDAAPFEYTVNKTALPPGPHSVKASLALDVLGKVSTVTRTVAFAVAEPAPEPGPTPEPEPTPTPEPTPEPAPANAVAVTTLADSGPGSLRACVSLTVERTCVFTVGGTITLQSRLNARVANSYLTIAGETAPAPGITLKGNGTEEPLMTFTHGFHDGEVRHLRFRKGPGGGHDNLNLDGKNGEVYNVLITHNSFSWATDENVNTYERVRDVTFSWNIIAEPLHCSTHPEGCHGKNGAMGKYNTGSQTFHHNLIMSAHDRSLKINQAYGVTQYINNVMHNNYDETNLNYDNGAAYSVNLIGNVWIPGPDSVQNGKDIPCVRTNGPRVYARDNTCNGVNYAGYAGLLTGFYALSAPVGAVTATSAAQAYEDVLAGAGATLPVRDATDNRLVQEVRSRTGSWKNVVPKD